MLGTSSWYTCEDGCEVVQSGETVNWISTESVGLESEGEEAGVCSGVAWFYMLQRVNLSLRQSRFGARTKKNLHCEPKQTGYFISTPMTRHDLPREASEKRSMHCRRRHHRNNIFAHLLETRQTLKLKAVLVAEKRNTLAH